jgi:hypothetical protein
MNHNGNLVRGGVTVGLRHSAMKVQTLLPLDFQMNAGQADYIRLMDIGPAPPAVESVPGQNRGDFPLTVRAFALL